MVSTEKIDMGYTQAEMRVKSSVSPGRKCQRSNAAEEGQEKPQSRATLVPQGMSSEVHSEGMHQPGEKHPRAWTPPQTDQTLSRMSLGDQVRSIRVLTNLRLYLRAFLPDHSRGMCGGCTNIWELAS